MKETHLELHLNLDIYHTSIFHIYLYPFYKIKFSVKESNFIKKNTLDSCSSLNKSSFSSASSARYPRNFCETGVVISKRNNSASFNDIG